MTSAPIARESAKVAGCPACGSAEWLGLGCGGAVGYRLRRCLKCRLIFSDPMLGADWSWYASSWIYRLSAGFGEWANRRGVIPWSFAQALSRMRPSKGSKLLDVGCGDGYFLHLARHAGYEVTGLDFNPVCLEATRNVFGIHSVYQYRVEELHDRFPGTLFDVVTIFEVLEHVANPHQTICSIRSVLKPGGRFFLSVPGSRRWPRLFHPEADAPPNHLTLWTEEALAILVERAGFRVHGVEAKPLGVDDLSLYLRLHLHQVVLKLRAEHPSDGPADQNVVVTRQQGGLRKKGKAIARGVAMMGLWSAYQALRLNPKAGGFTLFLDCEKA